MEAAPDETNFLESLTQKVLDPQLEHESALETHAYLVEQILPSVAHGLQQLLFHLQRHDLLKVQVLPEENDVETPDIPKSHFNPVHWLAQYLHRHNPKYVPLPESEYLSRIRELGAQLKEKSHEAALLKQERMEQRRQQRAADRERKRKQKEKEEKERVAMIADGVNILVDLFSDSFCRVDSGIYTLEEVDNILLPLQESMSENIRDLGKKIGHHLAGKREKKIMTQDEIRNIFHLCVSSFAAKDYNDFHHTVASSLQKRKEHLDNLVEQEIFFPAISKTNSSSSLVVASGNEPIEKVSENFHTFDSMMEFKEKMVEVIPNLENEPFVTAPKADVVTAQQSIQAMFQEFCTTKDPIFYAKLYRMIEKEDPRMSSQDTMYLEFKAFLKHLAGHHSNASVPFIMSKIVSTFRVNKDLSKKIYEHKKIQEIAKKEVELAQAIALEQELSEKKESKDFENDAEAVVQMREIIFFDSFRSLLELVSSGAVKCSLCGIFKLLFKNPSNMIQSLDIDDLTLDLMASFEIPDHPVDIADNLDYIKQLSSEFTQHSISLTSDQISSIINAFAGYSQATMSFHIAVQEKIQFRRDMENRVIQEISLMSKRVDLTVSKLCDMTVQALEKFFRNYYPSYSVYISLLERPASDDQQYAFQNRLRFVSCSLKDKPVLLNRFLYPGEGVSFGIIESGVARFVPNVRDPSCGVKVFGIDQRNEGGTDFVRRGSYFGAPLFSNFEVIGVLGMDNMDWYENHAQLETFKDDDLRIATTASKKLSECLDRVDKRNKLVNLGVNSMKWLSHLIGLDIEFYLIERDFVVEDGQRREIMKMWLSKVDALNDLSLPKLEQIGTESFEKLYLWQAVESKSRVTDKKIHGMGAIAIPLVINDEVVAVLSVRSPQATAKDIVPADQMRDLEEALQVFQIAVHSIRKESFGHLAKTTLAGEKIDEESRVTMLFPKLMLLNIRQSIASIDNSSIAEIRSYRKPPTVIHIVMKCIQFILGRKKAQIEKWVDSVKFINMDLLKAISDYDPTAVQKKKRFYRVSKELKKIPRGDIRKQGSKPTKDLYDWLIVALELRKDAVAARKRKAVLERDGVVSSASHTKDIEVEEEGSSDESDEDFEEQSRSNSFIEKPKK